MHPWKIILFSCALLQLQCVFGQEPIIDTLEVEDQHVKLLALWGEDTITLRRLTHPIVYDTVKARKWMRDSTYVPSGEEITSYKEFVKHSGQNCYSYALEQCFSYHGFPSPIHFDHNTWIGTDDFMMIVGDKFEFIDRIPTKPKRNLKTELKDGTVIVFRNKSDKAHHTFFYNEGVFYSKNGAWKLQEYDKMKDIYKRYWDTQFFEIYRFKN